MTSEDYCNTYWPQLRAAIDKLLEGPPPPLHLGPVIEFEPMYSAAYKCVCQQHSEALYNDLMSHIERHFVRVAIQLQVKIGVMLNFCVIWKSTIFHQKEVFLIRRLSL